MKFDLIGYDAENLIKTLHIKKIALYNVSVLEHNHITFEADEKQEHKIKRYLKNFKVKKSPKLAKKCSIFVLSNLGLILGIFFGLIFYFFASNFTWKITVYGTKELKTEEILAVLKTNGVQTKKINLKSSQQIEEILLTNYDKIAQVSVIKQGTHIIINLSEKLIYNNINYAPITAKYSGIITKINLITGTLNCKVGDYVNVGDLLVLPFNVNADGQQIAVKPMAEIEAEMVITNTMRVKEEETVLKQSGNSKVCYKYKLFNFNLFKGKNKNNFKNYQTQTKKEYLSSLIPFWREEITYYELTPTTILHNLKQEEDAVKQDCLKKAYQMLPNFCQFKNENVNATILNNTLTVIASITVVGYVC